MMARTAGLTVAGLLAFSLAACVGAAPGPLPGTEQPADPPPPSEPAAAPPQAVPLAAPPQAVLLADPLADPLAVPRAPVRQVLLVPPPPPPPPPPPDLMGMDRGALLAALGKPDFLRRDRPALRWQYRTGGCVLDVFLYRGAGGGDFTVTHVEARDKNARPLAETDCLKDVFDRKRLAEG